MVTVVFFGRGGYRVEAGGEARSGSGQGVAAGGTGFFETDDSGRGYAAPRRSIAGEIRIVVEIDDQ